MLFRSKLVIPGGIDVHTHLGSIGQGSYVLDSFATGTVAAALGGTTTVVDFASPAEGQGMLAGVEAYHEYQIEHENEVLARGPACHKPAMSKTSKVIALAIGDPNGIGPEIAVKAALATWRARVALVGDADVIAHYARMLAPHMATREFDPAAPARADAIDVVDVPALTRASFAPGKVHADAGVATVAYVKAALDLVRAGKARAIVACPHNETAVNAAGIAFSGYPELIAELCGLPQGRVFLMLGGGGLRIVHATLHERIHSALSRLTPELV